MTTLRLRQDPLRAAETERQLARDAKTLESLLKYHEQTAALLVGILATAREMNQANGSHETMKRMSKVCPRLAKSTARLQDLARQISVTIDDLQSLLAEPL
jgi:hypothetical protein